MKTKLYLLTLLLLPFNMLIAQDIAGYWKGEAEIQGKRGTVAFQISEENKTLKAVMDALGMMGIPVEKIEFSNNKLTMQMLSGTLTFNGELIKDEIKGSLKQADMELPLNLKKSQFRGNRNLPSSAQVFQKLAQNETGKYKYSVEDYFKKPSSSSFQLSPNGKYMSYRKKDKNLKNHVYVKDTETGKVTRVIVEKDELVRGYGWANNNRLVYLMDNGGNEIYHLYAVDVDGKNQKELTPYENVKVSILAGLKEDKDHMIISMNKNNPQVFEPYKINLNTGDIKQLYKNEDLRNPIMGYEFDKDGNLRGFQRLKDGLTTQIYYETKPGKFELIKSIGWDDEFAILAFDYASKNKNEAYVLSNLKSDRAEVYKYDLAKNKTIKKLFSDPVYDISGVSLSRKRNWELSSYSYNGEKYHIVPISDYAKKFYARLEKEFKNYEFFVSAKTDDEDKYLIYVTSDKLYGKYYFYDVKKDEIKLLFDLMPQLKEEDMAEMRPIEFKSRDGITLHGYITLPKEAISGKKVPVIVNPHGGPQGVRDSWGFNPEAQLFASRGYATLQVNFRISGGYGKKFFRSGFKQVGRKAMDDVEDGLKYVIDKGWVDPAKAAIYGASHGGYAVLRGLTKTPDLYACGVDYVGVSNLFTFMTTIPPYWKPYLKMMKQIWYDQDVAEEKEIMNEVSPIFHIDKIKKPLFVVQGANDPRVNIDESDQIVEALRDKNIEVPYMVKYDEGHGFHKEKNRMDLYKAMMGFFAKHLK